MSTRSLSKSYFSYATSNSRNEISNRFYNSVQIYFMTIIKYQYILNVRVKQFKPLKNLWFCEFVNLFSELKVKWKAISYSIIYTERQICLRICTTVHNVYWNDFIHIVDLNTHRSTVKNSTVQCVICKLRNGEFEWVVLVKLEMVTLFVAGLHINIIH